MSYLVLARKFRPQTFESVVGQEHISRSLANAIVRGRVPHAFLFTGPRGVGKTTSARVLARALNCTGRPLPKSSEGISEEEARKLVEPCGECPNCREIAKSSSVAVWEIDGASNNSVDNVRELIDSLKTLPPHGSQYKIYIIDEVHMLSVAAFNALLKSLEEPPPNTIFVFATTEPHKIPDTVISRCQRHDFTRITPEVISARLQEIAALEGVVVEEGVFDFIARKSQGGMRDAQSMLDRLIAFSMEKISLETTRRVFGAVDAAHFLQQTEAVLGGDLSTCFALVDEAFGQSIDVRSFFADFVEHWRNLMLLGCSAPEGKAPSEGLRQLVKTSDADFLELTQLSRKSTAIDLQRLFELAERTAEQALRSSFPRYVLEAGLAKMASLPSLEPVSKLLRTIAKGGGVAQSVVSPSASNAQKKTAESANSLPDGDHLTRTEARNESIPPPPSSSLPTEPEPSTQLPIARSSSDELSSFNPSWQDFLTHVRSHGEILLDAVLRRVSPKSFLAGRLVLEAADFDLQTISSPDTKKRLEDCLKTYSGQPDWSILLEPYQLTKPSGSISREMSSGEDNGRERTAGGGNLGQIPTSAPVPGSLAARESAEKARRKAEIEKEAENDPLVRAALTAFEGSRIEKIQASE